MAWTDLRCRLIHKPEEIFAGYIERGQTVLDIGCWSGTFTIAMAKMVGENGKVIAVDVQDEMLQLVGKKAVKEGMESRIITLRRPPGWTRRKRLHHKKVMIARSEIMPKV